MKIDHIQWNDEKDSWLQRSRGVTFERIAPLIIRGDILDVYDHPNQERYPGQQFFVIQVDDYVYLVPFVERDGQLFLKTIIPSRKAKRKVSQARVKMDKLQLDNLELKELELDEEEREILEAYESGKLVPIADKEAVIARLKSYGDATLRKDRRVNIRISNGVILALQDIAQEEGIPYQTLMASILHKYVTGRLIKRPREIRPAVHALHEERDTYE